VNALAAYRRWDPLLGRYAVGYHSTPYLMDDANVSLSPIVRCHEYVVLP
jgi:hypothetical protein